MRRLLVYLVELVVINLRCMGNNTYKLDDVTIRKISIQYWHQDILTVTSRSVSALVLYMLHIVCIAESLTGEFRLQC